MKRLNGELGNARMEKVWAYFNELLPWAAMVFILVATLFVAVCQSPTPPAVYPDSASFGASAQSDEPGTAHYANNVLHEGDVVSITFQYSTNYNALQKITLDGLL